MNRKEEENKEPTLCKSAFLLTIDSLCIRHVAVLAVFLLRVFVDVVENHSLSGYWMEETK